MAVMVGGVVGTVLGLIPGYVGSWVDDAILAVAEVRLACSFIFLAIALIAVCW